MPAYPELPELLGEIAEVAGLPAALAIAEAKGGTRAHFPARCGDSHWLTLTVGREAADKICAHFRSRDGGMSFQVPLGPHHFYAKARRRCAELRATHSIAETARLLGVSSRAVEKWTAASRTQDDRQGRLF